MGLEDELTQRRSMKPPPRVMIEPGSEQVKAELEQMIRRELNAPLSVLPELLEKAGFTSSTITGIAQQDPLSAADKLLRLIGLNPERLMKGSEHASSHFNSFIEALRPQDKLAVVDAFEGIIEKSMAKIGGVGERMSDSALSRVGDPLLKRFLQILISEYFNRYAYPVDSGE